MHVLRLVLASLILLGVEVDAGQQKMSAELVGVEPDRGLGRADRLAVLPRRSCPRPIR